MATGKRARRVIDQSGNDLNENGTAQEVKVIMGNPLLEPKLYD
ncbi:MAG TPA: hypothetical protein VH350_12215 [Candidatus Sulfotelmatobacter sp.]|nr:hypothetical protein [Candidatus Sulfotelmatobacter sp.]